jgi:hypothetical protein
MWKWLGGPYTNEHQNWGNLHTLISQISDIPPSKGDPLPEYELAFRACTEGVPLKGHLTSDLASCRLRNTAPLSDDLQKHKAEIDEKLR